jgi:tetratricopeptide (TPR) repeat protein
VILAARAGSGIGSASGIAWWQYLAAQGPVILRYVRLLVVPYGFSVDPDIAVPAAPVAVACWLVILGAAAYCLGRGWNWLPAALVLLIPSSSIFPAADLAADRRLYLPMVAISAGAGLALSRLRPAFPIGLLVALALISESRTTVWSTEERLWTEALERAPHKLRPKLQLARVLPLDRAEPLLREAEREAPEDARIPAELGRAYLTANRPADALAAFGRALALDPANPWNHNNRGVALAALGQTEAAHQDFEKALSLNPAFVEARSNLEKLRSQ